MVMVILFAQVVNVGSAHDRPPEIGGHLDQACVRFLLPIYSVLLNLEIDIVLPKNLEKLISVPASLVGAVISKEAANSGRKATGQGNHPFRVFLHE
jgi:hypothetical protein